MKKLLLVLLSLICILPLAGCLKKEAINPDVFSQELENRGYSIDVIYDNYWETGLRASNPESNINFELFIFDSINTSKNRFINLKIKIDNIRSTKSVRTEINGLNYNSYTLNNYSKYYYLVRVDERILYGNGDSDYKSEIKEIMKSLGY